MRYSINKSVWIGGVVIACLTVLVMVFQGTVTIEQVIRFASISISITLLGYVCIKYMIPLIHRMLWNTPMRWTDYVAWTIGLFLFGSIALVFGNLLVTSENPVSLVLNLIMITIAFVLFVAIFIYIGRIFDRATHKAILGEDSPPPFTHLNTLPYSKASIPYYITRPFADEAVQERGEVLVTEDFASIGNLTFNGEQIHWISVPNEKDNIRLDVEVDSTWYEIQLRAERSSRDILSALRKIAPKSLDDKSLHKLNIRYGAREAYVAEELSRGTWDETQAVSLYITPMTLVIFRNGYVWQMIAIDDIKNPKTVKHPSSLIDEALLLTFRADNQDYAFTIYDETFGQALHDVTYEKSAPPAWQREKYLIS